MWWPCLWGGADSAGRGAHVEKQWLTGQCTVGAAVQLGRHGLGAWRRKEEEGDSATWLVYLFSVILPVLFSRSDFSAFCLWGHKLSLEDAFGTPRYFGKSGEPVCSIPAVSLFFVSSPHSGCSALALPSLSQTGFQELQERVQTSQIFEEDLTLKTGPCMRAAVRAVFKLFSLEPCCTLGTITGGEVLQPPTPHPHFPQVNQNSYTFT